MQDKSKSHKIKIGLILFILGFIGVLSLLSSEFPMDQVPKEVLEKYSEQTLVLLSLINPTILLAISVLIGTVLYEKVELAVPLISSILKRENWKDILFVQLKFGLTGGVIAGLGILAISMIFTANLPKEFLELGEKLKPSLFTRLFYGGFTEEILLRFGLMTFVVWVVFKIHKKLSPSVYWIGIVLATLFFAVGHFPVVFQAVGTPSLGLLVYVLLGNSLGGFVFGWLYWKKGLESAFVAHLFTHVVMLTIQPLVGS
ncbi:MAG: CPBP family intramembrane metalloprotease [Leptospiraceae bacterium]|nr:CPBP family intramembrane metalloprotease [Leptospiraceae bacterium]